MLFIIKLKYLQFYNVLQTQHSLCGYSLQQLSTGLENNQHLHHFSNTRSSISPDKAQHYLQFFEDALYTRTLSAVDGA